MNSMAHVSTDEIKRDLAAFLRRIEGGEVLTIMQEGKPVAEIRPVASDPVTSLRPFGLCAGEFVVTDDFDEPLPESLLQEFDS